MTNTLFWRCSSKESPQTSGVIFGTIHVHHPRFSDIIKRAQDLLSSRSVFYAESDLDTISEYSPPQLDYHVFKQYVTDSQERDLAKYLEKCIGISLHQVRALRPMMISALVQKKMMEDDDVHRPSVDEALWNHARSHGIPRYGLETPAEQLSYLDFMPLEHEYRDLVRLVRNISRSKSQINKMIDMYAQEQIRELYAHARKSLGVNRKLMINHRNSLICTRIIEHSRHHEGFYCFGAAHLSGNHGVLRLLKQAGMEVKPL